VRTDTAIAGERLPLHGRIAAVEHVENAVLVAQDALHKLCRENEEVLKFAEMEKSHYRVHVRGRKKNAGDRRMSRRIQ
jgi:hypothetical protein